MREEEAGLGVEPAVEEGVGGANLLRNPLHPALQRDLQGRVGRIGDHAKGAEQGQVIAAFDLAKGHPARRLLADNDLIADPAAEDELIVRRALMERPDEVEILIRFRRDSWREEQMVRTTDPPA